MTGRMSPSAMCLRLLAAAVALTGICAAAIGLMIDFPREAFAVVVFASAVLAAGVVATWRSLVVVRRSDSAERVRTEQLQSLTWQLRHQVETLVETAPDAIVTVDAAGIIVAANHQAAGMFGYDVPDLVGEPVELLIPERLRDVHVGHRAHYIAEPRLRPMGPALDLVGRRADGSEFPIAVSLAPLVGEPRQAVLATVRDLTNLRAIEAAAAESAHRFAAAFDDAPVGMLLVDLDGRIGRVNVAFAAMLEVDPAALVGQDMITLVDPRDIDDDAAQRADLLAGRIRRYQREQRLLNAEGEPVWTLVSTALVRDAEGSPTHLVLHVEDVRGRKNFEGRLQYLADHDPLTGLFNRRRFEEEVTRHLAEQARFGGTAAVLMIDLDNFKDVNDTLGHSAGDAVVRAVAMALRKRLRTTDVFARLGGDEFAALLTGVDVHQAETAARELLDAVRTDGLQTPQATRVRSTASVGIAMVSEVPNQPSAESLLAAADLAMYAAKEEGRDRAVVYDPGGSHLARAQARFKWLDRIRTALEEDLFTLYAQPIVEIATQEVTQYELLLRMQDADGFVSPGRFIYIAERHGLGPAVDRWVLRHAIAYAGTLRDPKPKIEVNLSAASLADDTLPPLIADLLSEYNVAPDRMVFEVTETAAIANIDTARAFVDEIAQLGCSFALDDFGAGFGSFYYLKYLPFDYLKIDGEFIRQLATNRTDQLIVPAIVTAAHALGKKTIAEYVEDATTLSILRGLGVDFGQGYHLGRPTAINLVEVAPASA